MPTETVIFLAFTILSFGGFAATLWGVDRYSRAVRRERHPIPGE